MSTEGYAQFVSAMGHQVRQVNGVYWFNAHPHIYMSFPFDQEIETRGMDWQTILGADGWAARFPCDIALGRPSYRIIADQPSYGFESLTSKARNQTRRGLEQCEVRAISFEELSVLGLVLNRETLLRQNRKAGADFDAHWKKYYANARVAEGAVAWGAFVAGQLAAYLVSFQMEDVAHVLIVRSSSRFLKQYPNNALIYSYLEHSLNRAGLREVSIGLESIQEGMDTLDHFKMGMGFRKQPTGQRIILRPMLDRLFKGPGLKAARWLLKDGWGDERVAKLAGLVRWYEEQPRSKA